MILNGDICEHCFPEVGEPTEGVQEALNTLRKQATALLSIPVEHHFSLGICSIGDQFERIRDYMKYYKLPFDNIWEPDKPIGVAYIDDKGINFNNNWG